MPRIDPNKHSLTKQTSKPRSIAAANGATTTPTIILANTQKDDPLTVKETPGE